MRRCVISALPIPFKEPFQGISGGFISLILCSQNFGDKLQVAPPKYCVSFLQIFVICTAAAVLLESVRYHDSSSSTLRIWQGCCRPPIRHTHSSPLDQLQHKIAVAIVAKRAIYQSQWPTKDPALHPVIQPPLNSS